MSKPGISHTKCTLLISKKVRELSENTLFHLYSYIRVLERKLSKLRTLLLYFPSAMRSVGGASRLTPSTIGPHASCTLFSAVDTVERAVALNPTRHDNSLLTPPSSCAEEGPQPACFTAMA